VKRERANDEPVDRDATLRADDVTEGGPPSVDEQDEQGGDAACWVHLVCPDCGAVIEAEHSCASRDSASRTAT
jgi:hypothetical protein